MTPREFAEHVERETARISADLDYAQARVFLAQVVGRSIRQIEMLHELARQHAIEQERKG